MPLLIGFVIVLCLLLFLLYRSSIPTPIPGIPYTRAAIVPFGDVWAALDYQRETGQSTGFMTQKCQELQSPIVQMFMQPFKRPWVIISDAVLTEDILTRRWKEFEPSSWFTGVFEGVVPASHVHLTGEAWRKRRRAIGDLMSGQFLHQVAGPKGHAACLEMMDLWAEKTRLAEGKAFSGEWFRWSLLQSVPDLQTVDADIEHALLDDLWAIAFGSSIGSTRDQTALLATLSQDKVISDGLHVDFPQVPRPAAYETIMTISDSHEIPIRSPIGPLHHKLALRLYPKLRKAKHEKQVMIRRQLAIALESATSARPKDVACGADVLIRREMSLAEKEERLPVYDSPAIQDELYLFLQAGQETSATTIQWALKYLTAHQEVQNQLRKDLRSSYGSEGVPNSHTITSTHVPYLDAVIEETLRLGVPVGVVSRETKVDCNIGGYHVPARTVIIMTTCGPSYRTPALDPGKSKGYDRPASQFTGDWDPQTFTDFKPDRWITADEEGNRKFSSRAGPSHAMGTGVRHCFGKPLFLATIRVMLSVILLKFELQPLPADLESFDPVQRMTHRPREVYVKLKPLI